MVSITLRNIPEELLKRIRIIAARERRSLNSELLIVLEKGMSQLVSENSADVHSSLSSAGRYKIWKDLCGEWKEERCLTDLVSAVYLSRDKEEVSK